MKKNFKMGLSLFVGCVAFLSFDSKLLAVESSESKVVEIASSEHSRCIKEHSFVVLDVYATWCPPCKRLAPIIQNLASKYSDPSKSPMVYFIKMDLDRNSQFGTSAKVQSLPTLIFYVDGAEVERLVGFKSESDIEKVMSRHFLSR